MYSLPRSTLHHGFCSFLVCVQDLLLKKGPKFSSTALLLNPLKSVLDCSVVFPKARSVNGIKKILSNTINNLNIELYYIFFASFLLLLEKNF